MSDPTPIATEVTALPETRGQRAARIARARVPSVLTDTWTQMQEAQLLLVASSLAYTTILSIIPVLAVSFAIFKAFGGMDKLLATIQPFIIENLAEGADEQALAAIQGFITNANAGALGVGGLIGLIITTMSMLNSVESAINRVWHTTARRTLFQRIASYWFFVTLGPLAAAIVLGYVTSTEVAVWKFLPGGTGMFGILSVFFFLIYRFVPRARVRWQYALVAGTITSLFWNVARASYALYIKRAVTYSTIYGSLGAVPILLLWIYIAWIIVLTGAALTAALQKRFETRIESLPTATAAPDAPRTTA